MKIRHKFLLCGIAAAAFAAPHAYADPHGPGAGHGMMGSRHGGMPGNPAAMVEGHLAALKFELKITSDQETAWKTFADKARKQAEGMPARHAQMQGQVSTDIPAPERLAQRTEMAKQHIAGMESMTAAVKDLYGVLTPEQKKTADKLISHGPRGGFGGGGRWHSQRS